MTTPTVEKIIKSWLLEQRDSYSYVGDIYDDLNMIVMDGSFQLDELAKSLTTYGTTRYKEGVKAERERCKNLVVAHLRTNTYDGNDARVFKTTIEEVVSILDEM